MRTKKRNEEVKRNQTKRKMQIIYVYMYIYKRNRIYCNSIEFLCLCGRRLINLELNSLQ